MLVCLGNEKNLIYAMGVGDGDLLSFVCFVGSLLEGTFGRGANNLVWQYRASVLHNVILFNC